MAKPTEEDTTPPDPNASPARGISQEEWEATRTPGPLEKLSDALQGASTVARLRDALSEYVESEKKIRIPKLVKPEILKRDKS